MPELRGAIPELISFIIGLILSILGVPSITDIGIMIIQALQQTYPTWYGGMFMILLRLLGWFATIEVILRIFVQSRRQEYF
jgi:hypothetical protein